MRRILPQVAGLVLAVVFVLPVQAQPPDKPFPANTIEAKAAIRAGLKAIGSLPFDAIESRATLQQLAVELAKNYSDVPKLEELKRLLFLVAGPGVNPALDLVDPDRAPLKLTLDGRMAGFARQLPRGPNPDLLQVRKQTWPPDLTHGEKIALQTYSNVAFAQLNNELRTKGVVTPMFALVHERLQSAFRKAQPFDPPVVVSRGINLENKVALPAFLKGVELAKKEGKPFVIAGYSSTTVGPNVHPSFQGNIHLHIKAVHGLDVYPISLYPDEKEFLLNHNSTHVVKEIKMEQNRWIIQLEQIPPKMGNAAVAFPDRQPLAA
jgi:hypothetical protein